MIDIKSLSREDLADLREMLGLGGGVEERIAVVRKPLSDLRPQQGKKRLYRPHFEFSADDDGQQVIPAYPRLYWDESGTERRVESAAFAVPATWTPYPPTKAAIVDPLVRAQAEFDLLSPDDQQFVLEAAKSARLAKLNAMMATFSEADMNTLSRKPLEAKTKKAEAR
jgi:hypothetical protein